MESLIARFRSPKSTKSQAVFWTVLLLVLAATFVVSSVPLGLYTPTVGFQQSRHRKLPRSGRNHSVVSPAGRGVIRGMNQAIVAIGDVHGDLDRLRNVLRAANVLDEETDGWREGCTDIVVQLGDVVDRGPDAAAILQLLQRLKAEAAKSGGQVVTLAGNQEMMSLMGSANYVHPRVLEEAGGLLGFRHLYGVGGRYGRMFVEERLAVALISDVVFVHGGLTPTYAAHGIAKLNNAMWYEGLMDANLSKHAFHTLDSPIWDRSVVTEAMSNNCKTLNDALAALSRVEGTAVNAMVVGHTMTKNGKIGKWCDGRLVSTDVGMSRYIEGGGYEAYITIDALTNTMRRRKVTAPSRIRMHYPIGSGVHVASITSTTTENESPA